MTSATKKLFTVCQLWIPALTLVLLLTASASPRPRMPRIAGSDVLKRAVAAQLTDVPSHNRLYRASLVLTNDSTWTLQLRLATGAPVSNAGIAMKAWMPEAEQHGELVPTVSEGLGNGDYRVRQLAFDQLGWWNLKVQVSAAGGTDSLAFNVILR